jgi:uracil-DNA glycosylase family 4
MRFNLLELAPVDQEDIKLVMAELTHTCTACHLSFLHPDNRGMIWRGNAQAKIAVIGEAPGDTETEMGLPMVGPSGQEWERWAQFLGLDTKLDCWISNVLQCQPAKSMVKDKQGTRPVQDSPHRDEIQACFGPRSLRVLKAMPNLECVVTLGWVAAKALLGGEPRSKSHEGNWFYTNLLPGIPVFCLVHPSYLIRDPTPDKLAKVHNCLRAFRREYLESNKAVNLAKQAKEKF